MLPLFLPFIYLHKISGHVHSHWKNSLLFRILWRNWIAHRLLEAILELPARTSPRLRMSKLVSPIQVVIWNQPNLEPFHFKLPLFAFRGTVALEYPMTHQESTFSTSQEIRWISDMFLGICHVSWGLTFTRGQVRGTFSRMYMEPAGTAVFRSRPGGFRCNAPDRARIFCCTSP